ncbi:MAG: DRTGG domain-containing protein, partial [Halobacteria archaeon]|nr:DRTGG domain-containing protein [Halobacteria archaeon]
IVSQLEDMRDVDEILDATDAMGSRLRGVIFNSVADARFDQVGSAVTPFLEKRGIQVLGNLPRRSGIAGITVDELLEQLNASLVTEVSESGTIERFLVGAMSAETALRGFRRTKDAVVITGGDRPEIQRAALEAPGVKCLVLTGGFRPPGAVVSKAEDTRRGDGAGGNRPAGTAFGDWRVGGRQLSRFLFAPCHFLYASRTEGSDFA